LAGGRSVSVWLRRMFDTVDQIIVDNWGRACGVREGESGECTCEETALGAEDFEA